MSRVEKTMPETATSVETVASSLEVSFAEVLRIIQQARQRCMQAVNIELIEHYWQVGEYLHHKIKADGRKKLTVVDLSAFIARHQPGVQGYSPQNLWRMRQFYEYREDTRLSPLVRVLPWSHNLLIMSQCKSEEEREFYLRMAGRERWKKRELERQLASGLFHRVVLSPPQATATLSEVHPDADAFFKDAYFLEYLGLPSDHSETDLHRALLRHLIRPSLRTSTRHSRERGNPETRP